MDVLLVSCGTVGLANDRFLVERFEPDSPTDGPDAGCGRSDGGAVQRREEGPPVANALQNSPIASCVPTDRGDAAQPLRGAWVALHGGVTRTRPNRERRAQESGWSSVLQGLPITTDYKVDGVRDDALRIAVDLMLRKVDRQRHAE